MASDDSLPSPESERTFIMPSPGMRKAEGSKTRLEPPPQAPAEPVETLVPDAAVNPVVRAATPLLNIATSLRSTLSHPDPAGLRESLVQGIQGFETRARENGVPPESVVAARYVLCTFLDEVAASTPWGGSGVWGKHSLLVMFHNEAWGGEKVFQLMAKLAENPAGNRDLLELLYIVLALGFEGRYRVLENGRQQVELLRERLLGLIRRQRGDYERELSPHWKGVERTGKPFAALPVWVVLALIALPVVALYFGLSIHLNRFSDKVFADIQSIRAPRQGAVKAPEALPVQASPRLAPFLEPEIKAGLVSVADYGDRSVITINGDGLFEPGSATVADRVMPLLDKIGQALKSVPGSILVTGHTDNRPIRSARFPSNWHLSQERAQTVKQVLDALVPPERIKADGRADGEPLADNGTPQGRARNRRVEITLFATPPGQ